MLGAEVSRRVRNSRVSVAAAFVGGLASDVGRRDANRVVRDLDVRIAALGPEVAAYASDRLLVSLGLKAGVIWDRARRAGVIGTPVPPPPPEPVRNTWDEGFVALPSARVAYRVRGPVAANARVGVIQHMFLQDWLGSGGAVGSVGLTIGW